ncbi:MAG TPA: hypothetical protein VMH35_02350 [Streptosporangiaceae bacterium]|nr:hypothetical protein [Streptosporangiaceae bacterium]
MTEPAQRAELPLACTLGPADGAGRSRRWRQLAAGAAPVARRTGGRLEVRYQPGPGVLDELRALATAEAECCSFAAWAVTEQAGDPTLVVSAPADAPGNVEPIAAMFGV